MSKLTCPWLVTLAFIAACGGGESTPVTPEPPPAKGTLRHDKEVRLANVVQLTRDAGENAEAYWSPDGTELIFQSTRGSYQCDQIYRMPAGAPGEPTMVSTGKGRTTCAYFHKTGDRILYASTHLTSDECPPKPDMRQGYVWPIYDSYEIFTAKLDGSKLRNMTNSPGYDAEATVCPVDGSIVFTSTRDGDLDLYRMDADGKNVVRLTNTPGYDGGAFFSADCKQIVWRASRPRGDKLADYRRLLEQGLVRPSQLEIFVANADGSDARQVTALGAASFAPYMHPNGRKILFSTNYPNPRGREFDIWSINVDGSGLERVTYAPGFDGFPMFSPDGTKLAFSSNRNQARDGQTDVYVADWVEDARVEVAPRRVDRIAEGIAWLAADERGGRGVGTPGLKQSALWVARQMKAIGVKPGFSDGETESSYLQSFTVPVTVERGKGTVLQVARKPVADKDFVPASISSSTSAPVTARSVYVGYGIVDKKLDRDDYRGKSVRGKIAVIQRFVPDEKAFSENDVRVRLSDPHYKAFLARERGARGVVFVDAVGAAKNDEAELPELVIARQSDVGIPVVFARHAALGTRITARGARLKLAVELTRQEKPTANVVGVIPGTAPGSGAVVIGAHFDHLGLGNHLGLRRLSLEPGLRVPHNGADDNASGTMALIEVGRALAENPGQRDVYLVAFSAEELGLLGSRYFVDHPPAGLDLNRTVAMLNMDMVGRLRGGKLTVLGGATAKEWQGVVMPACTRANLSCALGGSGYGPSDQMSFYREGVPVLHFFTGTHSDYHKTSDDADRINALGVEKVVMAVAAIAENLRSSTVALTYQRVPAPLPPGDARSWGASLGTIPDYVPDGSSNGMLLAGVRPGGPAEKAGLRKGDKLIELAGRKIGTVRDLVYVLRDADPGQRANAVVVRTGQKLTFEVVFGKATRRPRGSSPGHGAAKHQLPTRGWP